MPRILLITATLNEIIPEIYDKYIVVFEMNKMLENICTIQQMKFFPLTCIIILFIFRFFLGWIQLFKKQNSLD